MGLRSEVRLSVKAASSGLLGRGMDAIRSEVVRLGGAGASRRALALTRPPHRPQTHRCRRARAQGQNPRQLISGTERLAPMSPQIAASRGQSCLSSDDGGLPFELSRDHIRQGGSVRSGVPPYPAGLRPLREERPSPRAAAGHGFQGRATVLELPLVGLLRQDRAREAPDRSLCLAR